MKVENFQDVTHFARTNFHNEGKKFGIRQRDRLSHMYVIGKTGVGKSTLLETLARADLRARRGFALIDPHGDLVERIWDRTTSQERERIIYLNAPDRGIIFLFQKAENTHLTGLVASTHLMKRRPQAGF